MESTSLASSRWFDPLTRWAAFAGFFALLGAAAITVTDALMRWLFDAPFYGWFDLSSLVYAVVIAACFPAGLLQGHNVTIRFLGIALGDRARYWLENSGAPLTPGFFVFIAWQFVVMPADLRATNDTTMTVGYITWPWWTAAPLIIITCVPVQAVVLWGQFLRAISGQGPGGFVASDVDDEPLEGYGPTEAI